MADENAATAETTNGGAGGDKKHQRPPRDETPIEELYDLSQPIPRVRCLKVSFACLVVVEILCLLVFNRQNKTNN